METEVLIVGAGPAGSSAAREIAEAGIDVLTIDRRSELGFPVQCGEFLPAPDELRRILPDSEGFGDLFEIPVDMIQRRTEAIDLFGPKGLSFTLDFQGMTIDRHAFDKFLWQRAERAGARLVKETEFVALKEKGLAETSRGDVRFKIVIGADGPLSRVRRSIGLPPPASISQAVTAQAEGEFDDKVRMYFGSVAPGGYAWMIPKRRMANVGVGVQRRFSDLPLSELLRRFLRSLGLSATGSATYGLVPVSAPVPKISRENALLVGDAAGQVMATNGGGVPIAMLCGRMAGRTAASVIRGTGTMDDYEIEYRRQIVQPLLRAARTKAMADLFFGSDRRLWLAMRLLGSRGLERAILCKRVFYIF